jgi:hypothetical protein
MVASVVVVGGVVGVVTGTVVVVGGAVGVVTGIVDGGVDVVVDVELDVVVVVCVLFESEWVTTRAITMAAIAMITATMMMVRPVMPVGCFSAGSVGVPEGGVVPLS